MTPILLLHGALGTKAQFESLSKLLTEKFEVYTMNFEGHGDFHSEQAFSIDLFTDNVIDFLDERKLDNISIFGYSMGGYVGLNLAFKRPELVNRIITYGTKFEWTPESSAKEVKMLNPSKIEEKVPAFAQKLEAEHSSNDWKVVMNKTAQMMLDLGNGECLKPEEFKQIDTDVLITIGSKDHMVSIKESETVANLLPHSKLITFDDFPHMIEQLDSNQLSDTIQGFIG